MTVTNPHLAPPMPVWGVVGHNIDRCINQWTVLGASICSQLPWSNDSPRYCSTPLSSSSLITMTLDTTVKILVSSNIEHTVPGHFIVDQQPCMVHAIGEGVCACVHDHKQTWTGLESGLDCGLDIKKGEPLHYAPLAQFCGRK